MAYRKLKTDELQTVRSRTQELTELGMSVPQIAAKRWAEGYKMADRARITTTTVRGWIKANKEMRPIYGKTPYTPPTFAPASVTKTRTMPTFAASPFNLLNASESGALAQIIAGSDQIQKDRKAAMIAALYGV